MSWTEKGCLAGTGTAGEACSSFGTCAPGFQCDYAANGCVELCDPNGSANCASPNQVCIDRTSIAGIPVGECG